MVSVGSFATPAGRSKSAEHVLPRAVPRTLTPWHDPTSSRNTDNRPSLNKDPYLGEGEATPTACPRTPKCGADWPRRTFAIRRKGPSCGLLTGVTLLRKWLAWTQRCGIPAFVNLAARIRRHREGIESTLEATIGLP